ncbi:hypothetical protein, partial [uncultured Thioclava sp.]|uniref:hypothetical protein n=1 Tax=uncultured Thioclava sp. TaxID=473858 RepID=UPI002600D866
ESPLQANTDTETARDLEAALVKNGAAEGGPAYRGADRLIQKLRKAKMISIDKRAWRTTSAGLELAQNLTELYNFTDAMDTK